MKKIVLALLLVLALVSPSEGQRRIGGVQRGGPSGAGDPLRTPTGGGSGSPPAGSACTTSNDTQLVDNNVESFNYDLTSTKYGTRITLSATTTVTEYIAHVCDGTGNTTGSARVALYTNKTSGCDGDKNPCPDSAISGSESQSVANTSIVDCSSGHDSEVFTLATPKTGIAAGTYWVVVESIDGMDVRNTYITTSGESDRACRLSGTWSCANDYQFESELWGCQ